MITTAWLFRVSAGNVVHRISEFGRWGLLPCIQGGWEYRELPTDTAPTCVWCAIERRARR